jgi:hypothetical protein
MAGVWDAEIKLLYAVDQGTFFTLDNLDNTLPFTVVANVEIGSNLNQFVDKYDLWVAMRNLTQSSPATPTQHQTNSLSPSNSPFLSELRVDFPALSGANDGDVIEAVAAFKVTAGANTNYSTERSQTFVVSVP